MSSTLNDIRGRLARLEKELHEVGYPPAPGSKFARIGTVHIDPSEVETLSRERDRRYAAASSEYNRLKVSESAELAWLQAEADRQRFDELIAGDAAVVEATEQHRQALGVVDGLVDLLRKVEAEVEKLQGMAVAALSDAPLGRLLNVARAKAEAVEALRASELARDEVRERLVTAQAQASEVAAELRSAQRAAVHRHIDELIGSTRDNLIALNDALHDITFWESQVHALGGRRQPFLTPRARSEIEGVCDRLSAEIRDVAALSETY